MTKACSIFDDSTVVGVGDHNTVHSAVTESVVNDAAKTCRRVKCGHYKTCVYFKDVVFDGCFEVAKELKTSTYDIKKQIKNFMETQNIS